MRAGRVIPSAARDLTNAPEAFAHPGGLFAIGAARLAEAAPPVERSLVVCATRDDPVLDHRPIIRGVAKGWRLQRKHDSEVEIPSFICLADSWLFADVNYCPDTRDPDLQGMRASLTASISK